MNFHYRNDRFRRTRNTVISANRINQLHNDLQNMQVPIPRTYLRDQQNPLESYSDKLFTQNFAFTKATFRTIYDIFEDDLENAQTNFKDLYLPPLLKLTIFMQYLRSNSFYRCVSTQKVVDIPQATLHSAKNRSET